jgi:hypothetical protein
MKDGQALLILHRSSFSDGSSVPLGGGFFSRTPGLSEFSGTWKVRGNDILLDPYNLW